jgi:hypothetical protein
MASPSGPTKNYPNFHAKKRVRRLPQLPITSIPGLIERAAIEG